MRHHQRYTVRLDRFLILCAVNLLLVSACSSSGGGDNASGTGVVNGYHLVSATSYDGSDNVLSTRTLEYDLELNQITTTFIYEEPIGVLNSTYKEFYNEAGRLVRRETPENNQLRIANYSFDEQGLITTLEISGARENFTEFEYDEQGRLTKVIETANDLKDDPLYRPSVRRFGYDDAGYMVSREVEDTHYFPDIDEWLTTTYVAAFTNNEAGQRVRTEETSDDSTFGVLTELYQYDGNGNLVERTSSDATFFSRTVYVYEANQEPVFNFGLRQFRFFP